MSSNLEGWSSALADLDLVLLDSFFLLIDLKDLISSSMAYSADFGTALSAKGIPDGSRYVLIYGKSCLPGT